MAERRDAVQNGSGNKQEAIRDELFKKQKKQDQEDEISSTYEVSKEERKKAARAMLSYAKPHRKSFLIVLFCSFIAIASDLMQPYLVKIAIDDHFLEHASGYKWLVLIGISILVLAVLSFIFSFFQVNILQRAGQGIVSALRKDLFRHITRLSMSFFDRYPSGSLVTNVSSDTETINQFFTQVFLSLVRDGLMLVMIIVFMFKLNARLAAYCMILLPLIAAIAITFRKVLRRNYQRARTQLSRMIAFIAENLGGMSIIQAFHQEDEQMARFTHRNGRYLSASLREVRSSILFNRCFDMLGNVSVAFVVWIGGEAVFHRMLEFGVLYAFINYIKQFFQPINQITMQWNTLQSTLVSMDRLWRIFSLQPIVQEPAESERLDLNPTQVKGKVDFHHIRFAYIADQEVLHDLDLHIEPGEFVGIVGATGAGKSSLMNLLNRFYDVNEGRVEIDGTDIRRIPQDTLHAVVGLVQQDPFLFTGSILDNVRLFNEDIRREEVEEACRMVGAHSMIERLTHGYDTRLSERGSGLSSGERQLISFARIVVFKPKILILDEATANLDSHTEQLIQQALNRVSRGRTTMVIAHRLSTIMHADRIIVMKHGRIVEHGKHEELLAQSGYYAELYRHSQGRAMQRVNAGGEG